MKIKELDRASVKELSQEIRTALNEIGELYGLRISIGNVSFSKAEFTTKITAQVNNEEVLAEAFSLELALYGLPADTIGRYFSHRGEFYKVQSVVTRKRKYPIICDVLGDDRRVAFGPSTIKRLLETANISPESFVNFGLPSDAYGKVFKFEGDLHKIAFINEADEDYPINCVNLTSGEMGEFDAPSIASYKLKKDTSN